MGWMLTTSTERALVAGAVASLAVALGAYYYYSSSTTTTSKDAVKAGKLKQLTKIDAYITKLEKQLNKLNSEAKNSMAQRKVAAQPATARVDTGPPAGDEKAVSSYYHFSSSGKRGPNKWDKYDVDTELEKIDDESAAPTAPQIKYPKENELMAIDQELESVLAYVDRVQSEGDEEAPQLS